MCDAQLCADPDRRGRPATPRRAPAGKQVWLLLHPEERRQLRPFLSFPMAGYLIKPVRRATLLRQLTAQDDQTLDEAVGDLRRLAKAAKTPTPAQEYCSPRTIR